MSEQRPDRVRIEDWANPQFPPQMAQLRASVEPLAAQLRLDAEVLIADASAQTGLDDFGDPGFEERLRVILYGMREEGGLSAFGRMNCYIERRAALRFYTQRFAVEEEE